MKRVLAFAIALVVTLLGMFTYFVTGSPLIPRWEGVQLAITLALFVGALLLAIRLHSWAARLLLIGAVALLILRAFDFAIDWLLMHDSSLIRQPSFLFPTDTPNPAAMNVLFYVWLVSFAFAAGLFWLIFRATHRRLTNRSSQRLTGSKLST